MRAGGKGVGRQAWTIDDLPLLDEADFLVNGRTRTYGHIVVDEAQDLSPMQFRMVARRAPTGSLTVLGDLAQATGAWTYDSWDEIVLHLPTTAPVRHDELTLGYRAPRPDPRPGLQAAARGSPDGATDPLHPPGATRAAPDPGRGRPARDGEPARGDQPGR